VQERVYSLDEGALPDGVYEIRLTVSDAPSNTVGSELTAHRLTPLFHVDTIAPVLSEVRARRLEGGVLSISGVARDESSPLRRIDVAVDDAPPWRLAPSDGLMDGRTEAFEGRVTLDKGQTGNWIVVRAQDAEGNRGTFRVWLEPQE